MSSSAFGAEKPQRKKQKSRVPRKRRAEVLEIAARVFHEQGYEATSIQDIADELGVLKGSVYYYISGKEDVLFELLQEVHKEALKVLEEAVARDGDPLQKIYAFVEELSRFNADHQVRMGIFLHDFRSLSEERRRQIVRDRDRYDRILRKLISEGQGAGLVCADLDPKLSALAVMGMINTIYQWYQPNGRLKSDTIGSAYAHLVTRALACDPKSHAAGHPDRVLLPTAAG